MSDTPEGGFTLEFIGRSLLGLHEGMRTLQQDVRGLQQDMATVKEDVRGLKADMRGVKSRLDEIQEEQLRQSSELTTLRLDISVIRERLDRIGAAWRG